MALLPADIPTGLVTANFYFVSEDNIDVDTDPDLIPVTGNVTFTCSAKVLRMPGKLGTLVPLVFKGKFDAQGRLIATNDPTPGLKLPATDTTDISPRNYTWHVDFDLVQVSNGHTVKIPSFDISVPAGSTVDLTSVMPVDTSPGTITIAGPQGIQGPAGVMTSMNDTDVAGLVTNTASTTRGALNATYTTPAQAAGLSAALSIVFGG